MGAVLFHPTREAQDLRPPKVRGISTGIVLPSIGFPLNTSCYWRVRYARRSDKIGSALLPSVDSSWRYIFRTRRRMLPCDCCVHMETPDIRGAITERMILVSSVWHEGREEYSFELIPIISEVFDSVEQKTRVIFFVRGPDGVRAYGSANLQQVECA